MKLYHLELLSMAITLCLTACNSAQTDVGSMGRLMQAPTIETNKVESFGDGADQQKFIQFKGTCNPRISELKFGYRKTDENTLYYVDTNLLKDTLTYTPDKGASFITKTNDFDCSDGSYDFVLTLNAIKSILGLSTSDVLAPNILKSFYLYGVTNSAESYQVEIDATQAGTFEPQTKIGVRKLTASGVSGYCETLEVFLNDQNGKRTTRSSDTPFTIQAKANGATLSAASYQDSGCTSSITSPTIPAGRDSMTSYYLFPDSGVSAVDFTAIAQSSELVSEKSVNVTVRPNTFRPVDIFSQATDVSLTSYHGCAVVSAKLYCWGFNAYGQLGNGNQIYSPAASLVNLDNVVGVGTGSGHTCALNTSNELYCWGNNYYGQLGNATTTDSYTPIKILDGIESFSVGNGHTCAITTAKKLYCWGFNSNYQLGDGTTTSRNTPTLISSGVTFNKVSAGTFHTCAITVSGSVLKCWGKNDQGQLGLGSTINQSTPQAVGSDAFIEISAGSNHSCGIVSSGQLKCWGLNSWGQLGNNSTMNSLAPVTIPSLSFAKVSVGYDHSCAVATDNSLYCWGRNNMSQLGGGARTYTPTPTRDNGLTNISRIAAGTSTTCAISSTAQLKCWGDDTYDQIFNKDGFQLELSLPNKIIAGRYYAVEFGVRKINYLTTARALEITGQNGLSFTSLRCNDGGTHAFNDMVGYCNTAMKFIETGVNGVGDINQTLTFSSPTVDGISVSPQIRKMQIDTTSDIEIKSYQIAGPLKAATNACFALDITPLNIHGAAYSPQPGDIVSPLITKVVGQLATNASGKFYSSANDCTADTGSATSLASIDLSVGYFTRTVYYKGTVAGSHKITVSQTGAESSVTILVNSTGL